jgi:hypothetical protein
MSDSNNKLTYAQVAANPPSSTNNNDEDDKSEDLNAYKSDPPTTEDENVATESTGRDTLEDVDEQFVDAKNYTLTGGAQFSKAADKGLNLEY